MATHVNSDTLNLMLAAVQKAMLALAYAYEDNERVQMKNEVLRVRKELIKATSGRDAS